MKYNDFGRTGLKASEIGFGCARLGGIFQDQTRADVLNVLMRALDEGINFYDTSDMYCQGESEKLIGEAFQGKRDKIIIASKVGYCLPRQRRLASTVKPLLKPLIRRVGLKREAIPSRFRGQLYQDFSAAYIKRAVEQSLRRLKTDYIDIYQLHSPPLEVLRRGEFLTTLESLRRQGKIRYYGVSCESAEDALICLQYPEISSLQIRVNLLDKSNLAEVLPRARQRGVGVIARECFGGGLLAETIRGTSSEASIDDELPPQMKQREIQAYNRVAMQSGQPLLQLALHFVLSLEGICVTLLGMRTLQHVVENVKAVETARFS